MNPRGSGPRRPLAASGRRRRPAAVEGAPGATGSAPSDLPDDDKAFVSRPRISAMALDPLPVPVVYLGTMATLLAVVFAVVHVVAFSESPPTDAEWRADAAALAGEVHAAAEADPWEGGDYRRLAALASRIQGHLRAAPESVDRGIERELLELSLDCRSVGFERTAGQGPPTPAGIDELDAVAGDAAALERRLTPDPTDRGVDPDGAGG